MKFIHVATINNEPSSILLKKAATVQGHEYIQIDPTNFKQQDLQIPTDPYMLYRSSVLPQARAIEKLMLSPLAKTFFANYERSFVDVDNVVTASIIHEKHQVPLPKTWFLQVADRAYLKQIVESLGGFPLVVKATGGSHGVGVMKVDSLSGLYSLLDVLQANNINYVLREMIDVKASSRLVVIGNSVVDSIEYRAPEDDFRSNEGHVPNVFAKKFDEQTQAMAIKAVNLLGLEFGGVDILIDAQGNRFLTEVNFPCYFPRCQNLTGTDVAGKMIEWLANK